MKPMRSVIAPFAAALACAGCLAGSFLRHPSVGAVIFGKLPMTPSVSLQPAEGGSAALAWDVHPAAVSMRKLSRNGSAQWTWTLDEGASLGRERDFPKLSRAPGGWYAVWMANAETGRRWEAQFITEKGTTAWIEPALVAAVSSKDSEIQACTASDGSLLLAWADVDKSTDSRFIGVAKLLDSGLIAWSRELGHKLGDDQYLAPALAPDDSGGVFLAYRQMGPSLDRGVTLQRFSADGEPLWPGGLDIYDVGGYKSPPSTVADGGGGVFLFWEDGRNGSMSVFAQRVSPQRGPLWAPKGVQVGFSEGNQSDPLVAPDGLGGAYVVWIDDKGSRSQLRLQHLGPEGKATFDPAGVAAAPSLARQFNPTLIPDGVGGAFAGWLENGYGQYQLRGQHFDPSGVPAWNEAGAKAVDTPPLKDDPQIASDGQGGLFFAWRSLTDGAWDIRAARLDARGKPAW